MTYFHFSKEYWRNTWQDDARVAWNYTNNLVALRVCAYLHWLLYSGVCLCSQRIQKLPYPAMIKVLIKALIYCIFSDIGRDNIYLTVQLWKKLLKLPVGRIFRDKFDWIWDHKIISISQSMILCLHSGIAQHSKVLRLVASHVFMIFIASKNMTAKSQLGSSVET